MFSLPLFYSSFGFFPHIRPPPSLSSSLSHSHTHTHASLTKLSELKGSKDKKTSLLTFLAKTAQQHRYGIGVATTTELFIQLPTSILPFRA